MHALSQLRFDLLERGPHAVAPTLALKLEDKTLGKRVRRRHSAELKRQVIAACGQPGASVAAAAAVAHGLNANLVHRWLLQEGACAQCAVVRAGAAERDAVQRQR